MHIWANITIRLQLYFLYWVVYKHTELAQGIYFSVHTKATNLIINYFNNLSIRIVDLMWSIFIIMHENQCIGYRLPQHTDTVCQLRSLRSNTFRKQILNTRIFFAI